jgi:hypothetical protein
MQDGTIPLPQRLRIRLHLMWCDACQHFEQQMRFLREAMQRYKQ